MPIGWLQARQTSMIRQELIQRIAERTGQADYNVKVMFEAMLGVITETLQEGEPVIIRGFGTFKVRTYAPRMGRNINTGEPYVIGKKRRVSFEPGKDLHID